MIMFVLNAAWQVPVVALAAAVAARLLPSADARHRLFLGAIGLSLLLPAAGVLAGGSSVRTGLRASTSPAAATSADVAAWRGWTGEAPRRSVAPAPFVGRGVVAVYVASLVLAVLRRGRAWRRTVALRHSAAEAPLPKALRAIVEECRRRLGVGKASVLLSPAVASPVTVGARHPLVLLPASLAGALERDQVMAAIGHELAHVRRRDFAWNMAAELASWPIAFHPATGWLLRRLRQARELACDALVAERVLEPRSYARALASLARSLAPAPAYSLGVADADILEERVMSLVTGRSRRKAGVLSSAAAALLLAAASAVAASYTVTVEPGSGATAVVGLWTGRVEQWGDLPSVDLKITEKDGRLSGRATYYLHYEGPNGREVGGKDETDLLEPRFDGRRLSFKVKSPDGKTHSVELRLTGDGQGDYVEVGAGAELGAEERNFDLVVKMKRAK